MTTGVAEKGYRLGRLTLAGALSLFSLLLLGLPDALQAHLIYSREGLGQLEWWRVFTAHLLHTNVAHWLMNAFALCLVLPLLAVTMTMVQQCALVLVLMLGTGTLLYLASPQIAAYVGLSGVLHGLFAWYALSGAWRRDTLALLVLALLAIKLIVEQYAGAAESLSQLIAAPVAVDAHLWGALAALVVFIFIILGRRFSQRIVSS